MYASANVPAATKRGQRGFSLVEALVVLVISAMLMSIFSQVYLGAERTHSRLQQFTAENRSSFYSRQQLRRWINGITYPVGYGQSLAAALSETNFQRSQSEETDVPLVGTQQRIDGSLWDPFNNTLQVRDFVLEIVPVDPLAPQRNRGQLQLSFDDNSESFTFPVSREPITSLNYIDWDGSVHAQWPRPVDQRRRQELRERSSRSLNNYLEAAQFEDAQKRLPKAILIVHGDANQNSAMIIEISS